MNKSANGVHGSASAKETATIEVFNGQSIRYQTSGSGPALVLMHTIRTQLEYFRYLVPALAERYTVYAIDLPAHGYNPIDVSASFDEPYLRRAVVDFIERLGLEDVTLVGESIGGTLALTVAATIPARIKRVVTSNTYDYETRFGDGIRRGNGIANLIIGAVQLPGIGPFLAANENKIVLGKVMGGGFSNPRRFPDEMLNEFDKSARRPGYAKAARKVLAGWRSWAAARNLYSKVIAPVTLVYGDKDWSRDVERKRTASLHLADMITLRDTGHFAAIENPDGLLQAILQG